MTTCCKTYRPGRGLTSCSSLLVLLPGIVAYGILYRQALPLPYQDDYGTILAFAADYEQLPSITTKLLYIATAQSNEYKLAFDHSIMAAEMEVTRPCELLVSDYLG